MSKIIKMNYNQNTLNGEKNIEKYEEEISEILESIIEKEEVVNSTENKILSKSEKFELLRDIINQFEEYLNADNA